MAETHRFALATINTGSGRLSVSGKQAAKPSAMTRMSILPSGSTGRMSLLATAASRKSILPQAMAESRPSFGKALGGGPSRQSMAPSQASRPSTGGRQSVGAPSASRRSSVHQAATGASDPRPLSDAEYRKNCISKLIQFLTTHAYTHQISMKMLTAPSNKDFIQIFQFLFHQFDPEYTFQTDGIEDEIITLVKKMKYPFTISKSLIISCGSQHNWPKLVGVLVWMIELIEYAQLIDVQKSMFLAGHQADEFEEDAANENEVFFDYLTKAYYTFFKGEEDFAALISELEDSFKAKNEVTVQETEIFEAENAELERELAELLAKADPLVHLTSTHTQFRDDHKKFEDYLTSIQIQNAKHKDAEKEAKQELEQKKAHLEAAEIERARLTDIKFKQALTPADVEKMNTTRRKQDQQLASVTQMKQSMEEKVWQQEIAIEKKLGELEEAVNSYNRYAQKLHLTGPGAKITSSQGNFALQVNTQATRANELLSANVNEYIRPAIVSLIDQITQSFEATQAEALNIAETVKKLTELKREKQDDISIMETKLTALEKQYEDEKEALSMEYKEQASTIESMQTEVSKLRASTATSHVEFERQLEKLKLEKQELIAAQNNEKKELHDLVFKTLEMVTAFKAKNQEMLLSLQTHARELRA